MARRLVPLVTLAPCATRVALALAMTSLLSACGDKDADEDEDAVEDLETDVDGDGYDAVEHGGSDCDDSDPDVNISAIEYCNGVDDDCDGEIDEEANDAELVYVDADGDGHGLAGSAEKSCEVPEGYAANFGDCDDTRAEVNPDAEEACDGVDTDCDGDLGADEVDADGDGFPGCELAAHGWLGEEAYTDSDCDDGDAEVYPGAEEVCDGLDTDCDGVLLDEEADLDGDGYNVCQYDDCDDDDASVSPGAAEDCTDGADQDCDELVDCADADCDEDPACAEDCENGVDDDADGLVDCEDGECADFEACVEVCDDGVDNDADGLVDCEDLDDCAGTTSCPVTMQVHLATGDLFMYAIDYGGGGYRGMYAYSLSGTVGTFDSAASSWKSCAWQVSSAYAYTYGTGGSISSSWSIAPRRWRTSVTGSCGMTQVASFLPTNLLVRAGTVPRVAAFPGTTAMGAVSPDWYGGGRSYTYKGWASYWFVYGAMSPQTFWR